MHKWTIEKIKETAAKYNSKTEFYKDYKYLQRLLVNALELRKRESALHRFLLWLQKWRSSRFGE